MSRRQSNPGDTVVGTFRPTTFAAVLVSVVVLAVGGRAGELAESGEVKFNVVPGGYPPFIVKERDEAYRGSMIDIFREISEALDLKVQLVAFPRKRVDQGMLAGQIDVTIRAREWVDDPDAFLFSAPVLRIRDVLFSRAEDPVDFEALAGLRGKRLGTHLGYSYPELEPLFADGTIVRDDGPSEVAMLGKVLRGRSHAAVVNEHVGLWLIKERGWEGRFHIAPREIGGYDYRFQFAKRWASIVPKIDAELEAMKADGRLEEIIARYR
jgi:polar amino acid transport system substrate-binding protein